MARKKVSKNNKFVPATKMESIGPVLGKQLEYMVLKRIKVKSGK